MSIKIQVAGHTYEATPQDGSEELALHASGAVDGIDGVLLYSTALRFFHVSEKGISLDTTDSNLPIIITGQEEGKFTIQKDGSGKLVMVSEGLTLEEIVQQLQTEYGGIEKWPETVTPKLYDRTSNEVVQASDVQHKEGAVQVVDGGVSRSVRINATELGKITSVEIAAGAGGEEVETRTPDGHSGKVSIAKGLDLVPDAYGGYSISINIDEFIPQELSVGGKTFSVKDGKIVGELKVSELAEAIIASSDNLIKVDPEKITLSSEQHVAQAVSAGDIEASMQEGGAKIETLVETAITAPPPRPPAYSVPSPPGAAGQLPQQPPPPPGAAGQLPQQPPPPPGAAGQPLQQPPPPPPADAVPPPPPADAVPPPPPLVGDGDMVRFTVDGKQVFLKAEGGTLQYRVGKSGEFVDIPEDGVELLDGILSITADQRLHMDDGGITIDVLSQDEQVRASATYSHGELEYPEKKGIEDLQSQVLVALRLNLEDEVASYPLSVDKYRVILEKQGLAIPHQDVRSDYKSSAAYILHEQLKVLGRAKEEYNKPGSDQEVLQEEMRQALVNIDAIIRADSKQGENKTVILLDGSEEGQTIPLSHNRTIGRTLRGRVSKLLKDADLQEKGSWSPEGLEGSKHLGPALEFSEETVKTHKPPVLVPEVIVLKQISDIEHLPTLKEIEALGKSADEFADQVDLMLEDILALHKMTSYGLGTGILGTSKGFDVATQYLTGRDSKGQRVKESGELDRVIVVRDYYQKIKTLQREMVRDLKLLADRKSQPDVEPVALTEAQTELLEKKHDVLSRLHDLEKDKEEVLNRGHMPQGARLQRGQLSLEQIVNLYITPKTTGINLTTNPAFKKYLKAAKLANPEKTSVAELFLSLPPTKQLQFMKDPDTGVMHGTIPGIVAGKLGKPEAKRDLQEYLHVISKRHKLRQEIQDLDQRLGSDQIPKFDPKVSLKQQIGSAESQLAASASPEKRGEVLERVQETQQKLTKLIEQRSSIMAQQMLISTGRLDFYRERAEAARKKLDSAKIKHGKIKSARGKRVLEEAVDFWESAVAAQESRVSHEFSKFLAEQGIGTYDDFIEQQKRKFAAEYKESTGQDLSQDDTDLASLLTAASDASKDKAERLVSSIDITSDLLSITGIEALEGAIEESSNSQKIINQVREKLKLVMPADGASELDKAHLKVLLLEKALKQAQEEGKPQRQIEALETLKGVAEQGVTKIIAQLQKQSEEIKMMQELGNQTRIQNLRDINMKLEEILETKGLKAVHPQVSAALFDVLTMSEELGIQGEGMADKISAKVMKQLGGEDPEIKEAVKQTVQVKTEQVKDAVKDIATLSANEDRMNRTKHSLAAAKKGDRNIVSHFVTQHPKATAITVFAASLAGIAVALSKVAAVSAGIGGLAASAAKVGAGIGVAAGAAIGFGTSTAGIGIAVGVALTLPTIIDVTYRIASEKSFKKGMEKAKDDHVKAIKLPLKAAKAVAWDYSLGALINTLRDLTGRSSEAMIREAFQQSSSQPTISL